MTQRNSTARTLHDLGLAAWFGGSLMGAIGVNGAAAEVDDPRQRARVANAGWGRWTPVNLAGIATHLAGAAWLTKANKGRLAGQRGVAAMSAAKTGLTATALAATAYSRVLGQQVIAAGDVPVAGGTEPLPTTPPEVGAAQKRLKVMQWVLPAVTGGLIGVAAYAGEQQRAGQAVRGVTGRAGQALRGAAKTAVKGVEAGAVVQGARAGGRAAAGAGRALRRAG